MIQRSLPRRPAAAGRPRRWPLRPGGLRLVALVALVVSVSPARAQRSPTQDVLPVVPAPQEVRFERGAFLVGTEGPEFRVSVRDTSGLGVPLGQLRNAFDGARPAQAPAAAGRRVWLGRPDDDDAFAEAWRRVGAWPDAWIGDEGYALHVGPDEILVAADTPRGLFYGAQTLVQLLRAHHHDARLPAVHVVDWPDLEIRGLMDDISRGPIPTPERLREQVRRLAEMKVNLLMYYTENVVATARHGDFAPAGGALSLAEWSDLAAYAGRYHVTLVGNFQSFGHFDDILAYPQYAPLGEAGTLLSPAFEASYHLLDDVYSEMIPAFGAPYFAVNLDEPFDLGKGASKPLVDSLGVGEVYMRHFLRLHDLVTRHGARMMAWGDVLLEHPDLIARVPKDVIIGTWTYDVLDSYDRYIEPFRDAGLDVLVASGVLNSYRTMPDFRQAEGNAKGFIRDGVRGGALGLLNTVWDDGGSALFARDWYGVALAADQGWHSAPQDSTFRTRFDPAVYGDSAHTVARTVETLVQLADVQATGGLFESVLWTEVVPPRGESALVSGRDWDEVRAIAHEAQRTLDGAAPRDYTGDLDTFRQTADLYAYLADNRTGLVDAADDYRDALLVQRDDRDAARRHVVDTLTRVTAIRLRLEALRAEAAENWLRENRTHALDDVLDEYDVQLSALRDVERRVGDALRTFDMGHPLLTSAEVRLALRSTDAWYFREWLMTNPIPNPAGADDAGVDFLASMGGETDAEPRVTQEFPFEGGTYRWRRVASPLFDKVDLEDTFGLTEHAALYAYATLNSPAEERVRMLLDHSDGAEVWLNGTWVYRHTSPQRFGGGEATIWLPLRAGQNRLLLKLMQGEGDWAFTLQLPDERVRNSKNRYTLLDSSLAP